MEKKVKLPKKFKEKWLEALRSGKYKRGRENLYDKNTNKYCCLGVACKIVECKVDYNHSNIPFYEDQTKYKRIPKLLREDRKIQGNLAKKNDNGWSFNRLADYIEKNY